MAGCLARWMGGVVDWRKTVFDEDWLGWAFSVCFCFDGGFGGPFVSINGIDLAEEH